MSLLRSVARNTAIQIIGKIISTLLGFLAFALMARALGVEKFGWYITATGFLQFIGIFSDFGFTVITSKMLSEPEFEESKILNTAFTWRFITALVFQGLAPVIIWFFPYPLPIKIAVFITTLSFFAIQMNQIFIAYFRAKLKLMPVTVSEVLGRALLVVGIAGIAFGSKSFIAMMAVITISSAASSIYLWAKHKGVKFEIDKAASRSLFINIWPTALTVLFNAFYLQGDRVILPLYVSQSQVGLYGAAYRLLDVVIQIAAIVMGITMPLITYAWSRNLKDEFKRRYQMSFDLLALVLLPLVTGMIVLSEPLMSFAAGQEFAASGRILGYLSLSILGVCFGMTFGHIVLAISRQKEAAWIYGSDAVLSIIGYFIFIPRFGIMGAAGVTIFSEFYAGIGLMLLTFYYSKVTPRIFTFTKIVLSSAIMGLIVYLLQPLNLALSILLGGAVYSALVLLFRIISPATIKEVLSGQKVAQTAEV